MSSSSKRRPASRESAPTRAPSSARSPTSCAGPAPGGSSNWPAPESGKATSPRCGTMRRRRAGGGVVFLVDTSAWIETFRQPPRFDLGRYGGLEEVATCLPVIQEVLQGFREETAFRTAREAMLALPMVESPLRPELFLQAADLFRAARRAGLTVRSGVD